MLSVLCCSCEDRSEAKSSWNSKHGNIVFATLTTNRSWVLIESSVDREQPSGEGLGGTGG